MTRIALYSRINYKIWTLLPSLAIGQSDDFSYFIEFEWITMAIGVAIDRYDYDTED